MPFAFLAKKIHLKEFAKHQTKKHTLIKFLLLVAILVWYFLFIVKKYGIENSFLVTALTRSFFVLCTPVADAWFLIDFPIRLVTKLKMVLSEIIVRVIAISLNTYTFFVKPEIYSTTSILTFFKHVLENPFPFWSIIIISMIGTFVSIAFGDELMDKVTHKDRNFYHKHKRKYFILIMIFLFGISFALYDIILKKFGINLSLLQQ